MLKFETAWAAGAGKEKPTPTDEPDGGSERALKVYEEWLDRHGVQR
jgi:hypothetical protein